MKELILFCLGIAVGVAIMFLAGQQSGHYEDAGDMPLAYAWGFSAAFGSMACMVLAFWKSGFLGFEEAKEVRA